MASFQIQPIARFAYPSKAIRRPTEIASFSFNDDHELVLDDSSLRYYYPPKLGADLSVGFDTFDKLDETEDLHVDAILTALIDLEKRQGVPVEADIVTWRGMGTKLMTAPFENRDGFEMNAVRFQLTGRYLEESHAYKLARQANQTENARQKMMSFWGYKFETLCLLPDTWDATPRDYIENRENEVVSNKAQYCSVVKTGFSGMKLILAGEVDAIWDKKPPIPNAAPINYVELKTSQVMSKPMDTVIFERKLCKFWAQSFLLGIPKIIVGFRTRDGIVRNLEELNTVKLPSRVKKTALDQRRNPEWDGDICTNFFDAVLTWLKQNITADGEVWKIKRQENDSVISIYPVDDYETVLLDNGTSFPRILSKEFLEWRLNRS